MATTTEPITTTTLTMSEAINTALREALDRAEPMMLIGQDIGPYGGTFGVTRGLVEDYGEERSNVIGMADHAVDRFISAVVGAMNG